MLCFGLMIFRLGEKTVSWKMISGSYFPNHDTVIRTLQNYKEMLEPQNRKGHLLLAWKKLTPKWIPLEHVKL